MTLFVEISNSPAICGLIVQEINSSRDYLIDGLIFRFLYENILLFATSQGYEKRFNLMKLKCKTQRI